MDSQFDTELSKEEIERLALLLEECGEVQQMIGKILRHGYYSYNPFDEDKTINKILLSKEVGDLKVALNLVEQDLYKEKIEDFYNKKCKSVNKYLHFNKVQKE